LGVNRDRWRIFPFRLRRPIRAALIVEVDAPTYAQVTYGIQLRS
jgi:hypothetical protein